MKRILALVMTLVMVLSLCSVTAYADTALTMNVSPKTDLKANDIVKVSVSLPALSEKISGWQMVVNYPSDKLEYVSYETVYDEDAEADVISTQMPSAFSVTVQSPATAASGKIKAIADCLNNRTISSTVRLFTLNFKVKSAAYGDGSFSVSDLEVIQNNADGSNRTLTGISVPAAQSVTIPKPPVHATGITFDKSSLNLSMKGGANSGTITANVTPADATDEVTWSVTPKGQKIVEISPNGKVCTVMAKAPGTVTITATVNGKSASCTVTVSACDHKSDAGHHHAEVPATCTTTGTKEYWECTECGMKFADQDCKTVLNDLTIAKVPHQFTKADPKADALKTAGTCSAPAVYYYSCASCGAVEKKDSHTFNGDDSTKDPNNHTNVEMQHNDKQHWGYCKDCKANIDKQDHFSNKPANKATCTKQAICDLCNEKYGDLAPHDLKKTNRVDPTCTAPGCKEYWTCNVCKGIFADEQGKQSTTLKDLTIPVANHTESSKYVAGATQHWKFCTVCGEVLTKVDHTYTNGKCVCGATNKDAVVDANHKNHQAGQHNYFNETKHWADCSDPNCAGHVGEANHSLTTKRTIVVNGKTYEVKECVCGYVTRVEVKNNTTGTTIGTNPNAKNPYEKNDTTKKDDGKKVESGKTFDAGIAMYVGLSVLSVTGGALVIGKKKEF